jgi:hypothetical protein
MNGSDIDAAVAANELLHRRRSGAGWSTPTQFQIPFGVSDPPGLGGN